MSPRAAPVEQIVGPYEAWTLGPHGQRYAGTLGRIDRARHLAAIAELPARHPWLASAAPTTTEEGEFIAFRPTLWRPGLMPREDGGPVFLPLVLQAEHPERRRTDLSALNIALSRYGGQVRTGVETGFRINGPLAPGLFDAGFAGHPREPAITPRRGLRAGSGSAPPLVLLAVIDDGIAFGHPALRDATGETRMEFCWLQAASPAADAEQRTVLFGREHTRRTIAELTRRADGDEERFYREAGAIRDDLTAQPIRGLYSHGAAVTALAAAAGPGEDLSRIRLIGVELPTPVVMDTVGFGKDAYVLAAIHYVFQRADLIAKAYGRAALPLVINFSFGFTGGPHDGTDRLEQAIADLVARRRETAETVLVMPSGNHFTSALHARLGRPADGTRPAAGTRTLHWRVQPCDMTPNYLEVWYPLAEARMPKPPVVVDPTGRRLTLADATVSTAPARQTVWALMRDGAVIGQVSLDRFRGRRWRLLVVIAPTEVEHDAPVAPAGCWLITVDAAATARHDEPIHARIQRDHSILDPTNRGRQSHFDDPRDIMRTPTGALRQEDGPGDVMRCFGTINGLATHPFVTVVAGLRAFSFSGTMTPATYSSAGETGDAAGRPGTVTCAAISDIAAALPGVPAGGTRAGAHGRLSGTSAAAPQVARRQAMMLAGLGRLSPAASIDAADIALRARLGREAVLGAAARS
jgi:hypothetical protein